MIRTITLFLYLLGFCAVAEKPNVTQLIDPDVGLDATVIAVASNENSGFEAIDVPEKIAGDNVLAHWRDDYLFMINGGYFEVSFMPVGLCRINGAPINTKASAKLSGFVAIDKRGALHLLTRTDARADYATLIQVGPYIIDPGGAIGILRRNVSDTPAHRTVLAMKTDGTVLVIVTKPVCLYDLARSLKAKVPDIERALNLDGGPSTALKTDDSSIVNTWPVRNYIAKKRAR